MGNVMIRAPASYVSKKEARQAVASECLCFLVRQRRDHHRGVLEDDEEEVGTGNEEHCVSDLDRKVPLTINLIDCPGHVEFAAEVAAALRVSDGAWLVVDALEGMAVQTEQVLIHALREGVKPVLMVNKVDRLILDLKLGPRMIYERILKVVNDVNAFIVAHNPRGLPVGRVSFLDGSVCFGSGFFGWSASIDSFVPLFMDTSLSVESIRKNLDKPNNFIENIVKPILRMHRACGVLPCLKEGMEDIDKVTRVRNLLANYGVSCKRLLQSGEDPSVLEPRKLLKRAMMLWLPAADAIVDMLASHVPSPSEAQAVRAPILYPKVNDPCGQGILHCDVAAPSVVFVAKMVANPTRGKSLLAFGRVFSGRIFAGDELQALENGSASTAKILRILVFGIGGKLLSIPSASAGQIVALEGVDSALNKTGTLTSSSDGKPLRQMVTSVSPILQHGVKPRDTRHLNKMVEVLRRIVKADGTAIFFRDAETSQYILAGAGTLHIEVLVSSLKQEANIDVLLSEPMIAYRETVTSTSEIVLAKSDNKHNRIFIRASPLPNDLVENMISGELIGLDPKSLGKELVKTFGWDPSEASRLVAVGPEPLRCGDSLSQPTCLLVDCTYGIQIPQDARDNIVAAFRQVTQGGVLVQSPMRGVRFDLVDAKFHQDTVHRRPIQVTTAASRAMKGAFLGSTPRLLEPCYRAEISGAIGSLNGAYAVLGRRNAVIADVLSTNASDTIVASLPARCALGLGDDLRLATRGHANTNCCFDGMSMVPESEETGVCTQTRTQKNLSENLPRSDDFVDQL